MDHNLANNVAIDYAAVAIANASSTDANTSIFDMTGFDGIVFITAITDCADTGVALLTVEQSSANADTDMTALTGATATATADGNDDLNGKNLIVDVYRPTKRFVQCAITSSVANIAFSATQAIRYKSSAGPITNDTDTTAQTTVVASPAEA